MDACSLNSEIVKAIPVLIGGFIAIVGTVVAQFISAHLTAARERRTSLRTKAEALVAELYAHREWLHKFRQSYVFRDGEFNDPSPLDKAHALQELYFPAIGKKIAALGVASSTFELRCMDEQKSKLSDTSGWLKTFQEGDRMVPLFKTYLEAWTAALQAATAEASKIDSR